MSNRSWNRLYMSIYEERWSLIAKEVAIFLIGHCINQYGVYKLPWWSMEKYFQEVWNIGQIQQAIDELKKMNFIKCYDNDDIVFILTKWSKEAENPSLMQRLGAFKFIEENYPEILADFLFEYPFLEEYEMGMDTHAIPITKGMDTHAIPITKGMDTHAIPITKSRDKKAHDTNISNRKSKNAKIGSAPPQGGGEIPMAYPLDTHGKASASSYKAPSLKAFKKREEEKNKKKTAAGAAVCSEKNKPINVEKKQTDEPAKSRIITDAYLEEYLKMFDQKPVWNSATGQRIRIIIQNYDGDAERIAAAIHQAFRSKDILIIKNRSSFISLTGPSILARADAEVAALKKQKEKKKIEDPEKYGKAGETKL